MSDRKRRERLHAENPHCYYCGVLTLLNAKDSHPHLATREHLFPKLHPKRREPNTSNEQRIVLACRLCNNTKSARDVLDFMSVAAMKARGMGPRNKLEWMKSFEKDLARFECF